MLDFYFSLPLWASGLLVVGLAVAVVLCGHRLAHALRPHKVRKQHTDLALALMGACAAVIGIMLAFAAVNVWDSYNKADTAIAQEASTIAELYRDLTVYGDETLKARAAVKTYVHAVLEDEWPRLSKGQAGPQTEASLAGLFRDVAEIQPKTPRETVMYAEVFKKLNEVVEHRRERLIAARAALPSLFWWVVAIGSMVIIAYTFVFPATPTNSLLVAGIAVSLGLVFMFILDVDHPFAGAYSVDNKEISGLLPLFDHLSEPPAS